MVFYSQDEQYGREDAHRAANKKILDAFRLQWFWWELARALRLEAAFTVYQRVFKTPNTNHERTLFLHNTIMAESNGDDPLTWWEAYAVRRKVHNV